MATMSSSLSPAKGKDGDFIELSASQSDNLKGIILAVVASAFIGSSFIVKKKGLKRAGASGPRASKSSYFFSFVFVDPAYSYYYVCAALQALVVMVTC